MWSNVRRAFSGVLTSTLVFKATSPANFSSRCLMNILPPSVTRAALGVAGGDAGNLLLGDGPEPGEAEHVPVREREPAALKGGKVSGPVDGLHGASPAPI